jgi:hypothetical protein
MSTVAVSPNHEGRRRENFPVESFRYLEAKLQKVRKLIMDLAARIAADKDPDSPVYRVGKEEIDDALSEFLSDQATAESQLGIKPVSAKPSESARPPGSL